MTQGMTRVQANLLLLVVALIWGSAFVAQSTAMAHVGPMTFTGLRFLIGAAVVLPWALREWRFLGARQLRPGRGDALQIAGLDGLIDIVAASEDTTAHKPEPAPLQHGAARLSVPIEQCVYVGDAVVDIEAARAAGMASIAVTWGAGDPEALAVAGADHLVESPAALYALLLGR